MAALPRYAVIEDRYLVAATLAGRRDAFDELVRRYRGAVILVARRVVGSHETAQDVAQDAFVVGFSQLRQLQDARYFGAWIRVIARNLAVRQHQRDSKCAPVDDNLLDLLMHADDAATCVSPEEALIRFERDSSIRRLIVALPDGVQMVVQLYYGEQWSVAQIAAFLSLNVTTVKWRLHSGRKKISRRLGTMIEIANPVVTAEAAHAVQDRSEVKENCYEDEPGDKAHPPHTGRDRLACGG